MFNRRGQSVNEYAILLGIVVAAILAMQTLTKKTLQGRLKDIADIIGNQTVSSYSPEKGEFYSSEVITNQGSSRQQIKKGGLEFGRVYYQGIDDRTKQEGTSTYKKGFIEE